MVKVSDPTMFDDFQTNGLWSFSEDMDKSYSGTLNYDANDGKFTLTLYSSEIFESLESDSSFITRFHDKFSLFGMSYKREFVHLINCSVIKSSSSQLNKIVISCNYAIFGPDFFIDTSQEKISKVHFGFLGLDEWIQLPIWNIKNHNEITLNEPSFKEYKLSSIKAILKENYSRRDASNSKKLESNSEIYYTLDFDSPQSLEEIEGTIFKIVQFFYFLFSVNLPIKFIVFNYGFYNFPNTKGEVVEIPNKYRVYHAQISPIVNKSFKYNRKIKYSAVSPHLEPMLNNWINDYAKLKSVIQTFVGDLQMSSFVENQFLNACRNLEVLHRVLYQINPIMPEGLENARLELLGIIEKYPPEIEKHFESRINFYEGKTLGNRVKELISKLPPEFSEKIISFENKSSSKSKKKFIAAVTQTRNYITHGNTNKEQYPVSLEGVDLFISSRILNLLTEYFIFTHIGMDQKLILEDLSNNERYWIVFNKKLSNQS